MDSPHNGMPGMQSGPQHLNNFLNPAKQNLFSNIFANHPLQRTFASVVSCGNPGLNFRQSTSKLMNSFIEAVIKQEPPKPAAATSKREFNDYRNMPNWRNMNGPQQKYSHNVGGGRGGHRYRPPNKKFHYSQQFHDSQTSHHAHPKNRQEKERFSIERDIRCDISNRFASRGRPNHCQNFFSRPAACTSTTTKSPTSPPESIKSPPFEIFSLEEFPAIVTTTLSMHQKKDKQDESRKQQDVDEHDFVKFQSDIARTTPTYVQPPIRFNLCEAVTKIVSSPKKLLNLPLNAPRRSCLKATPLKSRNMSECSDDFIVFDYTNGSDDCPYLSKDTVGCVSEDEDDDDDAMCEDEEDDDSSSSSSSEDEEEDNDECDNTPDFDNNNFRMEVQQPDSGVEERKVHFNAAVKVNVIRAWEYAYRQARKGDEWLQSARDRERFSKRIQDCGTVLRPILSADHRRRVFDERFETTTS